MVVPVYELLQGGALVTREGATRLAPHLADAVESCDGTPCLTLDLAGTVALAPGFFDELLGILTELSEGRVRIITITNPPRPLAKKDRTVARRRGAEITEVGEAEWEIRLPAPAPA